MFPIFQITKCLILKDLFSSGVQKSIPTPRTCNINLKNYHGKRDEVFSYRRERHKIISLKHQWLLKSYDFLKRKPGQLYLCN